MSAQRRAATKQEPVVPTSRSTKSSTGKAASGAATARESRPKATKGGGDQSQHQSVLGTRWESLRKFLLDTWAEIKKVVWPDAQTTRNLTLLVILMSTVLGLLLGGIDFVLLRLFEAI